ncbi:hypothetical protein WH47_12596 [Habropoda laboriosa]|uniref:Uncharacterized protein n=1 Tax=Habropoda laboriosa TaxID=597456 RepID=A0A0L7R7D3_9HYME|nr:hypothetical protein WH47_12596 [Habropoda laboriosa]
MGNSQVIYSVALVSLKLHPVYVETTNVCRQLTGDLETIHVLTRSFTGFDERNYKQFFTHPQTTVQNGKNDRHTIEEVPINPEALRKLAQLAPLAVATHRSDKLTRSTNSPRTIQHTSLSEVSGENVSASSGPRGGDRGEATDLGTHTENNDGATLAANTAVDARGGSPQGAHLSGAATPRPPRGRRRQNQNGLDTTQVKTERLTPDNNSTSSRSVTPSSSSHPGTPPNATPLGGPEGPPPPHHLKHMEQMMGRNYSDFMRSLAAKYNNANPNDYFSSPRNGYPPGLDPRFPAFKTAATPFVGLMAPLGAPQPSTVSTTSPLSSKDPKEQKQDSLFGNPVFPPMLDMSSTQALLHMVRTANAAQNAAELETYLKGANKRDAGVTSPLDLSSPGGFAPRKRQRAETRRAGSVSPKPKPTPRPTTPPPVRCPSLCGHMPCGDGQAVNRWTIEDVVNYVSSIDICAEYAQVSGSLSFLSPFDCSFFPSFFRSSKSKFRK